MNERRQLIPAAPLKRAPKPVRDAESKAERALDALGKGRERATKARVGVRAAREADAEAITRAARGEVEAKPPTEPAAKAELEAAERGCKILADDFRAAIRERDQLVLEHQPELIAKQAEAYEAKQAEARELQTQLREVLRERDQERAVLNAYLRADDFREGSVRGKQHTELGKLTFVPPGEPGSRKQALAALRAELDELPPRTESEGQRKEREQREAGERAKENRAWRQMGTAAVIPTDMTR